jgi:putative restriction endonuclease
MHERRTQLERAFGRLRVWQKGGERALNKPLTLLLALGRVQRGLPRMMAYAEVEGALKELLVVFGPPRAQPKPYLGFWHLQSDGFWEVVGPDRLLAVGFGGAPLPIDDMRLAQGGFSEDVFEVLCSDAGLVEALSGRLLAASFPKSLHAELAQACGLRLGLWGGASLSETAAVGAVSEAFRLEVVHAYGCRCAVCGFGGLLDGLFVGVEATRVRWDVPEAPDNGLCLCHQHVRLFDRGLFTLSEAHVLVSGRFVEWSPGPVALGALHGQPVRAPVEGYARVAEPHAAWHRRNVFRAPSRAA